MSIFIDRKYLLMISPKLERFTQKKTDLYNFRCPICGDSQKNLRKCRAFIFKKKNEYKFICHNCGVGHNFYYFLDYIEPNLIKEYMMENFEENGNPYIKKPVHEIEPSYENMKTTPLFREKINLPCISDLHFAEPARMYVESRMIPKKFHSQLYYAKDYRKFIDSMFVEKKKVPENDERLVIPFYDQKKNIIGFQGRTLTDSKARYITVSIDENVSKYYGLDRVDFDTRVYVLEGPIDSMFLPNAIATADSKLTRAIEFDCPDMTIIYDNEPRNKDILRGISGAINLGLNVCLFPKNLPGISNNYKDINDLVLLGMSQEELVKMIDSNTYQGLRAELEFNNWKEI